MTKQRSFFTNIHIIKSVYVLSMYYFLFLILSITVIKVGIFFCDGSYTLKEPKSIIQLSTEIKLAFDAYLEHTESTNTLVNPSH